jgi:glucose/arabinose dehydrogenase
MQSTTESDRGGRPCAGALRSRSVISAGPESRIPEAVPGRLERPEHSHCSAERQERGAIRENLKRIKLPPGFKISLYAVAPDARHMAVAPSTNMLFVGTRKTTVWAVTNRNSGDMATEVKAFAPSLNFKVPNGVCWTKDGFLIVVEHNRVLNFPAAEFRGSRARRGLPRMATTRIRCHPMDAHAADLGLVFYTGKKWIAYTGE